MQIIELDFIQNTCFLLFLHYIFYIYAFAQIRSYVIYWDYDAKFHTKS